MIYCDGLPQVIWDSEHTFRLASLPVLCLLSLTKTFRTVGVYMFIHLLLKCYLARVCIVCMRQPLFHPRTALYRSVRRKLKRARLFGSLRWRVEFFVVPWIQSCFFILLKLFTIVPTQLQHWLNKLPAIIPHSTQTWYLP